MPPNQGLVHPKEYDIKDSNVELIGSDMDHRVKYNSAATEPAWNDGAVGTKPGLRVWRIEQFQVVPWPEDQYGRFYDGDSFIVLHSYKAGKGSDKLGHDIFFWLGNHTTHDEAGTAAYKTVELDEFLHGAATQHREVQSAPSDEFLSLFPRLSIRSGGARTGFRHVEQPGTPREPVRTLLRVFTNPSSSVGGNGVVVHEVEPAVGSLDDGDVFVLDVGDKIWVWQGRHCSPMEKARAAQVVHDMTLAKHIDVEVVAQNESRSRRVTDLLGGRDDAPQGGFRQRRPMTAAASRHAAEADDGSRKLFRLSDASGQLTFALVKDGGRISQGDLDGDDVYLLDDGGKGVWVWEGAGASRQEKAKWLSVAQAYILHLQRGNPDAEHHLVPLAKVNQGNESRAFLRAMAAC
ncbi:actin-binding protein Fragmin, putative [Metarhizium acridum CQMa 102]|uniref:Actin-binding protein Fragmin, putative n=1 Tax=Metarhizium acridum (strain CQMa 102) TaxID=655827 RepID=E9E503_METAQ|nr:actin-binding protein Fragmin, putative [Metarhizium acridum CQMa 102]EFY89020.1 actin-binding protein Fragmin, putative [Metarhizium acridum CQMa 102]